MAHKSFLFLVFFISLYSLSAQSQDSIVNALKVQIKKADSDSLRIKLVADLTEIVGKNADLKARKVAIPMVLDVLKTIEDKNLNTPFFQKMKAESLQNMATFSLDGETLSEALEWQQKATDYSTEIKDTLLTGVGYWGLGTIRWQRKDTLKAKQNFLKSLDVLRALNTDEGASFYAQSLIHLGHVLQGERKLDSARLLNRQAIAMDKTGYFFIGAKSNIANTYKLEKKYDKALQVYKEILSIIDSTDFKSKSSNYQSIAISYLRLNQYKQGIIAIDSAIYNTKQQEKVTPVPARMKNILSWKKYLLYKDGQYKKAYNVFLNYDKYKDTVTNLQEEKRLIELELNYEFDKERELAAAQFENETSKKRLYFILMFVILLLALVSIYVIIQGKKRRITKAEQEIAHKETEKIKSDLALANRENELKKVVIENSITEEVLNKTLDDIKEIITYENEGKRKIALRSLSASLLSEKTTQKDTIGLQSYVDEVAMEFKILLDQKFPEFNTKEKELLYLIKLGLTTIEVSKVLNTSISSVKSKRYRIRKKLDIDPSIDIIAHIEQYV